MASRRRTVAEPVVTKHDGTPVDLDHLLYPDRAEWLITKPGVPALPDTPRTRIDNGIDLPDGYIVKTTESTA